MWICPEACLTTWMSASSFLAHLACQGNIGHLDSYLAQATGCSLEDSADAQADTVVTTSRLAIRIAPAHTSAMGSTSIPAESVFAAHGLFSVTLDIPTPASSKTFIPRAHAAATSLNQLSGWVTGDALLTPVDKFPVFRGGAQYRSHPVNFAFCPIGDPTLLAQFRRQAQFRALDSLDYTIGTPPHGGKGKEPATLASEVIAWWEDENGLWMVVEQSPPDTIPFIENWSTVMLGARLGDQHIRGATDGVQNAVRTPTSSSLLYANVCETLSEVARRLKVRRHVTLMFELTPQTLHNKRLSLLSCSPGIYQQSASSVQIIRYTEAIALSGLDWHVATLGSPIAGSALFKRDPPDPALHISDQLIRRNLRFVPPETAVTRYPSPSGAIYSFGVMAYELLTGSSINGGPNSPDEADVDLLTDIHRHLTVDPIPIDRVLQSEAMIGGLLPEMPPRQLCEIVMKCLCRDIDDRYATLDALLHDLGRLSQICRSGGDLDRFIVGKVDRMSRFNVPDQPVHRVKQLAALDEAWAYVNRFADFDDDHGSKDLYTCNVNLWGASGSGKSRLAHSWVQRLDIDKSDSSAIVGYAKMDEHIQNPLSSFTQAFQSLIDQVLTDPGEDAKKWNQRIREAVGTQFPFFLALLSNDIRKLLQLGGEELPPHPETINWDIFINAFSHWHKRLLQLFATARRPLVLLIDDIQWLQKEEKELWRRILDDAQPLNHCLIVTLLRTDSTPPPDPLSLLSVTAHNIHVPRLDEDGVEAYLAAALQGPIDNLSTLTSFLYAETSGSPLFLRTLVSSLVLERVLYFDYDVLVWRFEPVGLQRHLSDTGVDAYLGQLVNNLPDTTRKRMMLLSLLPANGFKMDHFAALIDVPPNELRSLLDLFAKRSTLVLRDGDRIKFSHDRARMAAYHSIPVSEVGDYHRRVSIFLRRPELVDDYLFEAADHALSARGYGAPKEDEAVLVGLLLDASKRASLSAGFVTAKRFLDATEEIITETGGYLVWTQTHRRLYIRFLAKFSDVCSVLRLHQRVYEKLDEIEPLCESPAERIKMTIWRVRQYISQNRPAEVLDLTWECMSRHGFDVDKPLNVRRWIPQRPEDVYALGETIQNLPTSTLSEEEDPRVLIMTLLAFAGPTIFVADPHQRAAAFLLGISLVASTRQIHEPSAYMAATQAITTSDVPIKEALCELAKSMARLRPGSFLAGSALTVVGAQAHCWMPLEQIAEEMDAAYEECHTLGNFELAAYVFVLDCTARSFSLKSQRWSVVNERYASLRTFMEGPFRPIVGALLQFHENVANPALRPRPWALEGDFISVSDTGLSEGLLMHYGFRQAFALRLAVYLNAPIEEQALLVEQGLQFVPAMEGTIGGPEWSFLSAVVLLRGGRISTPMSALRADLKRHARSPDWQVRLDFLEGLETLNESGLNGIPLVETILTKFEADSRHYLAGLLNSFTGDVILQLTGSLKLATGFLRAAFTAYQDAQWFAAAETLRAKYPGICNDQVSHTQLPSEILGIAPPTIIAPELRRASLSAGNVTVASQTSSSNHREDKAEDSPSDESLDTLTLMRSSLALASETDPNILLCTLLRILCQFVRADFAAIALSDEQDPDALRLRAAGPFGRILPYNHALNDEAVRDKAPAHYMMHVARTGKTITKPSGLSRVRHDPFYTSKPPRSIVCQPILNQGVHAGVILLSSSTYANSPAVTAGAREVIGCLATFATIVMTNASFTDRLKEVVDQRTKELSNALAAKTRFLSQCSHELRSPLSAVLGLAAVLEASPGLSGVQREHLRTIISSGEDLLGLINNILDHSKLENGSVTLERIPFTLRDVIESGLDTIAAVAQKKNLEVSLVNGITSDPPALIGDPFRIKQILLNLLSNAVKFTPKGTVTVKWRFEEAPDEGVIIHIDVQDTGIGIPASKMDKLFQSFSQIDESITRSFGGSGLGLIISKDLARLLGGDCVATSELGKGSKFTFSFTASRNPDQPPKEWEPLEKEKCANQS